MSALKGTNVTKLEAGASGDNVIADGYVKTVEKVWLDTYVFTAALPSDDTIQIATIPANKKITSIDIYFPVLSTGATLTCSTITIGDGNSAARYLAAAEAGTATINLSANTGLFYVTGQATNDTKIILTIGRIATTTTAGTIKTIVRYT